MSIDRIGWQDGVTNGIDRLLDYGRPTGYIAERLHIPLRLVRRRRRERLAQLSPSPAIPPDRQLEIAMAALYPESDPQPHTEGTST